MKIKLKVHANSAQEKIKEISNLEYEVWLKEKPIKGKANSAIIKIMKKYFNKDVKIISGFNSNKKVLELS